MKSHLLRSVAFALASFWTVSSARGDIVTDWNAALEIAQKSPAQAGSTQARSASIMNASIFDAVNGLVKKYDAYRIAEPAPAGASPEAAAIYGAYTAAVGLYPAHKATVFDPQLASSLAALRGPGDAIASGRAWGENVALQILAWRATDGFGASLSFVGSDAIGVWRSTAAPGASGISVQLARMAPFTLTSPWQFRPPPPYGTADPAAALRTAAYAADFDEVKAFGGAASAVRSAQQEGIARFWHAVDNADQNRVLRSLVAPNSSLVDNARLFALASFAAADAGIVAFDCKYTYPFWRPITAIHLAAADENSATAADPGWAPLITTPMHPEYLSAHSIVSGAMLGAAAQLLGENRSFTLSTPAFPSVTRTYANFSSATAEVGNARMWAGLHFRSSCDAGRDLGVTISSYVTGNFLRPRAATGEAPPRMVNLSVRATIVRGGVITAGFVIEGTRQKTVLIRGIGPSLAAFGVSGALADPKLEIVSGSGQRLAENDNWPSGLAAVFTPAGAFALAAGSKDAAAVLPLQPGAYTVTLTGADGGGGEGLVEVYEVQ